MLMRDRKTRSFCPWLFLLTLAVCGCGKKNEPSVAFAVGGAPAELDFWQELTAEFEKQTDMKIDLLRQPTDTDLRKQGLVTALRSAKTDPDVFLMDVAWLTQFSASGWLEPLDSYVESSRFNTQVFFEKVLNLVDRHNGRLIALPVYVDGGVLYYRKDLLEKYGIDGPPQTWQQLVEQAQKVQQAVRETNPNFYGFVWQGAQYEGLVCTWLEFAGSHGGGIGLDGRDIEIDTKENIEATQFMFDLIHKYGISPPNTFTEMKEEEVRIFFQQGNALFERNWPYAWVLHQGDDSPVKGKVGIAALPHRASNKSVSTLGGWHIGMSKYSDAKQESFEFIKFVLSYETQKKLALKLDWNPARRDVYTDADVVDQMPHFVYLRDVFENLYPRPNVPYYTMVSEVIQRYVSGVLSGKLTASQALSAAESDTRKIIEKYNPK